MSTPKLVLRRAQSGPWASPVARLLVLGALLVGLPIAGVWLAGRPLAPYFAFPPQTVRVEAGAFSWAVFLPLAAVVIAAILPFALRWWRTPVAVAPTDVVRHPFPLWGWLGVALMVVSWVLAWTRLFWFAPLQAHTFTPLWLGFIVTVNALTVRRTGHALLIDRPEYFLLLFVASAVFWWFFEYLNRFVHNWYYAGTGELSAWEYFLLATLPFSTVIPAVLSVRDYLASFPRLQSAFARAWPLALRRPRALAWAVLLVAGLGLLGIGIWPTALFPLLWLSPLFVIVALQVLWGERTLFAGLAHGDWRPVVLPALAALVCGFFWEMWNWQSVSRWEYAVPYVQRFELFEMPLLGYAGYLPFGLEVAVVADLVRRLVEGRHSRFD